jgi:hypothetical protein
LCRISFRTTFVLPNNLRLIKRRTVSWRATAAPGASEPVLHQRHVAFAGIDQALQVGIRLVAARIAEHDHADMPVLSVVFGVGRPSACEARG